MPALALVLRAPLSAAAWTATVHVVLGLPLALLALPVLLPLLGLSAGLLLVALLGLLPLWFALRLSRLAVAWERLRAEALLGVRVELPPRPPAHGPLRTLRRDLTSPASWRALAHTLLLGPLGTAGAVVVLTAWSAGLALTSLPLYALALPADAAVGPDSVLRVAGWTAVGLALLLGAPWVARGVAHGQVALLRALVGVRPHDALAARVEDLEASRAGVVDAADAERRRIERDLHDGAQPRLVRVAMELGRARAKLDADPADPEVRGLLDVAHEEAKLALADLRDLARGIHPSVLTDRGLDAALPPLAARAPVPVELMVHVAPRPPRAIEAVAYFVVSEALTNAAKYGATAGVRVRVTRGGRYLVVEVADTGPGGAIVHEGGGLAGLERRVAAVDGQFSVDSRLGKGTRVRAVLPCAS